MKMKARQWRWKSLQSRPSLLSLGEERSRKLSKPTNTTKARLLLWVSESISILSLGEERLRKPPNPTKPTKLTVNQTGIPSLSSLPFLELVPIRQKPNSLFITCSSVEHFLITSVLYFVFVMSSKLIIHKYTFESLFLLTEIWKKALLLD